MNRLLIRLYTRRCKGCDGPMCLGHHLTWLGRWRYFGSPTR